MLSVIDILRRRAARGGGPPYGDGASVALCVEGGAMRGVISAGMVSALEALGLTGSFDAAYGSSAGSLNAAYFLAGQAALGATIYYDDINNRRFIDLRRPLRNRPIVNLDFLVDDIVGRRKRLDVARVLASTTPLSVLATHVASATAVRLDKFADAHDLVAALRASATMPIVAGGPGGFRGGEYFDASLTEPIPVPTAEADGHSHILVLLTRPGEEARTLSLLDRVLVIPRLKRLSPALAAKFIDRGEAYRSLLNHIAAGSGPLGRAVVFGIRPMPPGVGKLERRRDLLQQGAERGYRAVMQAFDPTSPSPTAS
jgi:predicted patatin/cPLA2 family phospholipase